MHYLLSVLPKHMVTYGVVLLHRQVYLIFPKMLFQFAQYYYVLDFARKNKLMLQFLQKLLFALFDKILVAFYLSFNLSENFQQFILNVV